MAIASRTNVIPLAAPDQEPSYPSLPLIESGSRQKPVLKPRVCIVSQELAGPSTNGGIGTFCASLAQSLAETGHHVTVLFVRDENDGEYANLDHWKRHYSAQNITLEKLHKYSEFMPNGARRDDYTPIAFFSFQVMRWLCANESRFDIVHFPDWWGLGYYAALVKHEGLALQDMTLAIDIHGPLMWGKEGNRELVCRFHELEYDFIEGESIRLADVVIAPSYYIMDWMTARGWRLPERSYVQHIYLPRHLRLNVAYVPGRRKVSELVFFGRREERKGLIFFCEALEKSGLCNRAGLKVTFLGRNVTVRGKPSDEYIRNRTASWKCDVHLVTPDSRENVLAYLRAPGRLAVMPSLLENAPSTVMECLEAGIPFIAADVGGVPEFIAPEFRAEILFPLRPLALAKCIDNALEHGIPMARSAVDFEENERRWVGGQAALVEATRARPRPPPPQGEPLVSVVLVHFNRPAFLRQALKSLEDQTYKNIEVVLVDCGSTNPDAVALLKTLEPEFHAKNWRIVQDEDSYLGAARNLGVDHARGDYVLFMDDDNYAKREEISTFVTVALRTGADILTCANHVFNTVDAPDAARDGNKIRVPLGGALAAALFGNVYGDSNAFVKKESFLALGGFSEDFGIGNDDWEFFGRAIFKGQKLLTVPLPLYWHRLRPNRMTDAVAGTHKAGVLRALRSYTAALDSELSSIANMAVGLWLMGDGASAAPVPLRIPPQMIVNRYWDSPAWRYVRRIRTFTYGLVGKENPEKRPIATTYPDANEAVFVITNSAWWHVFGLMCLGIDKIKRLGGSRAVKDVKTKPALRKKSAEDLILELSETVKTITGNQQTIFERQQAAIDHADMLAIRMERHFEPVDDILKLLKRNDFFPKLPSFSLASDFPVAAASLDHTHPRGTRLDNTRWQPFFEKCRNLYGARTSLLDLGCAGGGLVADFIFNGFPAVGLEGSDYSKLRGRAEWQILREYLFTCDITQPFTVSAGTGEPYKFKVISAWEVLEHLPAECMPQFFANLVRHLDEDGLFFATAATHADPDPDTGVDWHVTVKPRDWWVEQMQQAGLYVYENMISDYEIPRQDCLDLSYWLVAGTKPRT